MANNCAETVPGYVYFLTDGKAIKIGYSKNPKQRFFSLQGGCPTALKPLGIFPGTKATEHRLHDRFDHLLIRGEWFELCDEITDYIDNLNAGEQIQFKDRVNITCIPRAPKDFKSWADRACVTWSGPLQAKAYHAWLALEKSDEGPFNEFIAAYGASI